ncbi:MAG: lysophospholipid acyltransferase family protein [Alphaproteobacteria bacterium]|nr:lysophospholipid acyltransferase family protein [Alphaproteobacteria bacterium]
MRKLFKYLSYPFEALLFSLAVLIGFLLPFSRGSATGAFLGGSLGPLLSKKTKIIRRNFQLAGLEFTKEKEDQIIKEMWQNLGRTFLEYVRLPYQSAFGKDSPYTVDGLEHLDALIYDEKPGLLFSAHCGNWEVGTYIAQKRGLKTAQVTRFLNNPLTRFLVNTVHKRVARKVIPKGTSGAKEILIELKKGHHVSLLADQKMNDGLAIPFFGRNAMTAPALAKMALKFDCPVLPFQVIRTDGVKCKVIYYPPLSVPKTGTPQEKTENLLKQMNTCIETWIREHPEQWFWVHRRWPKELYQNQKGTEE